MTEQRLSQTGLTLLVALANTFVCISLDMYLPAIPGMAGSLHTTAELVNLTLVGYYAFLAVGILTVGPLSDQYGRRKLLILHVAIYTLAGAGCACSPSVGWLIAFRILQALGAGGMVAISTALIKDCFAPEKRGRALAITQAVSMIGPLAAPLLGSGILLFFSWRATFVILSLCGLSCLPLALRLSEPLPMGQRIGGGLAPAMGRLLRVGRNPAFSGLLLATSLLTVPFMGYIAVSSYVYIDCFGLSPQRYSLFFAVNTLFSILAPVVYLRLAHKFSTRAFLNGFALITISCGGLLLALGPFHPALFLACMIPVTMSESLVRPCSIAVLLEQQQGDTGSASSLINFAYTAVSSAGMLIASANNGAHIANLGFLCISMGLLFVAAFALLPRFVGHTHSTTD